MWHQIEISDRRVAFNHNVKCGLRIQLWPQAVLFDRAVGGLYNEKSHN